MPPREASTRVPRQRALAALASLACTPLVDASADSDQDATTSAATVDPRDDTTGELDPYTSMTSIDDDTTADSTTDAPWDFSCSSFDPTRVYLHGTLSEGLGYVDALVDPTSPTEFCVGFGDSGGSEARVHPFDGHVVYEHAVKIHGSKLFTGP